MEVVSKPKRDDLMKIKETKLKKLMKHAYSKFRSSGMPEYSSKFSPKKYTQHQHSALLVFKKRMKGSSYRDAEEYMNEMPEIQKVLGLNVVPDHSSIQKFFERISESWLYGIILRVSCEIEIQGAIGDGTGMCSSYSSAYYDTVIERKKMFQKMVIAIDPGSLKILNVLSGIGPGAEQKFLIPLLQPLMINDIPYAAFDKGFDANYNFEWLLNKGTLPLIAIKGKPSTKFRKIMNKQLEENKNLYNMRVLVESVFSVVKRKFGDSLNSRKPELKNKEQLIISLTYNFYVDTRDLLRFSTQ